MILPCGVTGFRRAHNVPLPSTNFASFKAACFEIARRLGGLVVLAESCEGRVTPNFHRTRVSFGGRVVDVLCNAHYPLVGFAEPLEDGSLTLMYLDVSDLEGPFVETGSWRVLKLSELQARILPETLSQLSEMELAQVKSWKAKTIGEVVFNFWD